MRPRNTLLLLLVLAALGAYVWWVELPEDQRKADEARLLAFDKSAVAGLTITTSGGPVTLEKSAAGTWRILEPVATDADATAVNAVVTALDGAIVTRTLDDAGAQLGSYGLEQPEVTVTVKLADGTTLPAVKVGKTTAVGGSSYVQRGDETKVLITTAAFQTAMKRTLKDLRDKTLVAFEDQGVTKIQLDGSGPPIELVREGEGDTWTITTPERHPADPSEVRALLASARGVRADEFVSDAADADLAPYGLVEPRLRLEVTDGKGTRGLLVGGERADEKKKVLYAKRVDGPTVVTVPDYVLKNLDKTVATLRDKTILSFPKDAAAKIVATRKDGTGWTLVKRDGAWHVEAPPGEGIERTPTMTRLLDDLASLKGNEILAEGSPDLAQYGLGAPDLTIVVSDANGAPLASLIGARGTAGSNDPDAKAYLAAQGGNVVYGVKAFTYDRVDKRASDFREMPATPRPGASPGAAGDEGAEEDADEAAESDLMLEEHLQDE